MAGKPVDIASAEAGNGGEARTYQRSTIGFPYGDVNAALSVADAIHNNAGTECTVDQLAAFLGHSSKSGTFRMKLSTARIFGLIETKNDKALLTSLGRQAVDPEQRDYAAAKAFLTVPLFRAVYDKYIGQHLPPAAALEREIASLGVARKQAGRARQAFERSAEQGGFFHHGRERLVEPTSKTGTARTPKPETIPPKSAVGGNGGGGGDLHPFIVGLLDTLPIPNTSWPSSERQKWLKTAEHIFSLIYADENSGPEEGLTP